MVDRDIPKHSFAHPRTSAVLNKFFFYAYGESCIAHTSRVLSLFSVCAGLFLFYSRDLRISTRGAFARRRQVNNVSIGDMGIQWTNLSPSRSERVNSDRPAQRIPCRFCTSGSSRSRLEIGLYCSTSGESSAVSRRQLISVCGGCLL